MAEAANGNHVECKEKPVLGKLSIHSAFQFPRLVRQHDGDTLADGKGKPGFIADEFLPSGIVTQRRFGQRANKDIEKP
jgi:hypothetical protein